MTDALPDILKALETAEKHAGDAVDALEQCNKDLTLSAADRAELSAASGRIQTNSAKLKAAADSLNTAVNDLKEYLDGTTPWDTDAVRGLLSDAIGYLDDAVSAMAEISTDMAKIAAILSDFLKDAAPKAHDDIQRALDALSDAAASLDTATGKTRRLMRTSTHGTISPSIPSATAIRTRWTAFSPICAARWMSWMRSATGSLPMVQRSPPTCAR